MQGASIVRYAAASLEREAASKAAEPSKLAQDRALAQQLWEASERAVGAPVASGARRSEVALIAPQLEGRTVLCMPARRQSAASWRRSGHWRSSCWRPVSECGAEVAAVLSGSWSCLGTTYKHSKDEQEAYMQQCCGLGSV